MIALGDHGHLRALDRPQVALPRQRLVGLSGVVGVVIPHLPHEQRRRVDHGHPDPIGFRVTGNDDQIDRLLETAVYVRQHRGKPSSRRHGHRHPPAGSRRPLGRAILADGRHHERRLLLTGEAANLARDHDLPAADERARAVDQGDGTVVGIADLGRARHPPGERGRRDPDPRGRCNAEPGRHETRRRHHQTLRGREFINARRDHQDRQRIGEPQRRRAVDGAVARHAGELLGRSAPQRLHYQRRRLVSMRPGEHRVDHVVVKIGMLLLEDPCGIDEIHAIPHQR